MMKKLFFIPLVLGIIILAGCDAKDQCLDAGGSYKDATKTCEKAPQGLTYSNLVDQASQEEVKSALLSAGISEENVARFFGQVEHFNDLAGRQYLLQSGFVTTSGAMLPEYDLASIMTNLQEKSPDFVGYNCRITSFGLMKDLISIEKPEIADASQLFIDQDAIATSPQQIFSPEEQKYFESFYSRVPTTTTKDQAVHYENIKKSWSEKGLSFKNSKASLISVWMHSHFEGEEDYLFIGHIGVLVDTGKEFLFIEKLAFDQPYQAIKFITRADLYEYLMKTYDKEYNQPTARPLVMENDHVLGELLTD